MRYFMVRYLRRTHGTGVNRQMRMEEEASVSKKLRRSDIQSCAVILDFRDLRVVQAHLDGNTIPKDFDKIASYYHQHYGPTIDQLCKINGVTFRNSEAEPPVEPSPPAADQSA